MLFPLATMAMVLVAYVHGQGTQDIKKTGEVDSSYLLAENIDDLAYMDKLQNDLLMPNMDISILYQGWKQKDKKDEQINYPFNPVRVRELMKCEETMAKEKNVMDQASLADAILQSYMQQILDSGSEYNPYYIGSGEHEAALIMTDEMVKDDADILPVMMIVGFFDEKDLEGDPDDEVTVGIILASPNEDCRDPYLAVKQEVDHDGVTKKGMMMKNLAVTQNDPAWPLTSLPTFVTHSHVENSQSAVVNIGTSEVRNEPWFSKLPSFYQLLLSNLHTRDSLVVQLHEYTRVTYILPYCEYQDKWYRFGQQVLVRDVCKVCMCGPEFQGKGEDSCYLEECLWIRYGASFHADGCVPIHRYGHCCPDIDCPGKPLIEDARRKMYQRDELFDSDTPYSEEMREKFNRIKRLEYIQRWFPNGIFL